MGATRDIQKATGVGAVGFGVVAVVAPRLFFNLYGLPDEPNVRTMTRLWGTRTAALGALSMLLTDEGSQRTMTQVSAVMNGVDAVMLVTATGVSGRAKFLGSLTSAGFGAALAYAATR